jgi:hypothetical protein
MDEESQLTLAGNLSAKSDSARQRVGSSQAPKKPPKAAHAQRRTQIMCRGSTQPAAKVPHMPLLQGSPQQFQASSSRKDKEKQKRQSRTILVAFVLSFLEIDKARAKDKRYKEVSV